MSESRASPGVPSRVARCRAIAGQPSLVFVSVVVIIGTSVAVVFVDAVVVVLLSVVIVKVRLIHHEWRCRSGRPRRVLLWLAEPRDRLRSAQAIIELNPLLEHTNLT